MGRLVGRPDWLTPDLIEHARWLESRVVEIFELYDQLDPETRYEDMSLPLIYEDTGKVGEWFNEWFVGMLCFHSVHLQDIRPTDVERTFFAGASLLTVVRGEEFDLESILNAEQMSCVRSTLDFLTFVRDGDYISRHGPPAKWLLIRPLIRSCGEAT